MENSKIEWTDHTFNPWIGCTRVSEGCRHCYAETLMDKRWGKVQWGPQGERKRTNEAKWREPIKWNRQAELEGRRFKVFCGSLCDVFEDRPDVSEARRDLMQLIEQTRNLDWQLLTKRPENVSRMVEEATGRHADAWLADCQHVWIGTSVEDQATADQRIPELLKVPARLRFLSAEPLLGPIDLFHVGSEDWDVLRGWKAKANNERGWANTSLIHWVIVGGESGPHARPMHPDWARSLRDQCQAAGVAYFFKQWGEYRPFDEKQDPTLHMDSPASALAKMHWEYDMYRVGKKAAGRLLDGVEWNQFPLQLETA